MSTDTHPLARYVDAPAPESSDGRRPAVLHDAESRDDSYLVVRVGGERFALPLHSVAEALDAPVVLGAAGVNGHRPVFVDWRGRRLPLIAARMAFGVDADFPCAVALVLDDALQPLAVTVDELCDVRVLPPASLRPFVGRHDAHRVVRSVALDGGTPVAVVNTDALRSAILAGEPSTSASMPRGVDVMARSA